MFIFKSKSDLEIRYIVERNTMPNMLYPKDEIEKTKKILQLIENGREKMMWIIYSGEYELSHKKCPYTESQFNVNIEIMSPIGIPKYTMIIADLPKPEAIASCSKMIICYCENYEYIRYYVVEKAFDGNKFILCGWDEQHNHLNYGNAPDNDNDLKKAVNDIYGEYLRKFFNAYKAELDPIRLQSITDAVRTTSYLICDVIIESSLLDNLKLSDNYVDQTAMLVLELAIFHNHSDSLLENALLDQLPSLTSNSLSMVYLLESDVILRYGHAAESEIS